MTRFHLLQNRTARRRLAAVAVLAVAISLLAGGGALAARHAGQPSAPPVDSRVNALLAKMTLQEKLEQIQLLPDFMVTDQEVKNGLGSVLSVTDSATINRLQHIAVDQSRLHIPLLFAFDTIASRPRSGSSRRTPRWWTSRTSRGGGASLRVPARTRISAR